MRTFPVKMSCCFSEPSSRFVFFAALLVSLGLWAPSPAPAREGASPERIAARSVNSLAVDLYHEGLIGARERERLYAAARRHGINTRGDWLPPDVPPYG